jgi:uncharacterized protein
LAGVGAGVAAGNGGRLITDLTISKCSYIFVVTCRGVELRLQWTWDAEKNRNNRHKHGLSFEAAQYVFADPLAVSLPDPYSGEERWQTIGLIGQVIVFVVHTWPEFDSVTEAEIGRIISARKATAHERRAYEEGTF